MVAFVGVYLGPLRSQNTEPFRGCAQFSQGAEVDAGNGMGPDASLENAMSVRVPFYKAKTGQLGKVQYKASSILYWKIGSSLQSQRQMRIPLCHATQEK